MLSSKSFRRPWILTIGLVLYLPGRHGARVEDLRTPLREILYLERQIRGTIAGFLTPQFVVNIPGGGGKRLAASYESYDAETGVSRFLAPGVKGSERVFEYYDPLWSLSSEKES